MGRQFRGTKRFRSGTSSANWVQTFPDFQPLDLPNLAVWFDAADTSTITASGGFVSQWNDKSGNGRNASQGTASLQPETGIDTQNGLNVITFRTLQRRLDTATFSVPNGAFSVYAAVRHTTSSANFIVEQSGDTSGRRFLWRTGNTLFFGYHDGGAFRDYTKTWTYANNFVLVGGACDGDAVFTNVSQTLETRATRTGFPVAASRLLRIGQATNNQNGLAGVLGELLLYDAPHSFQERRLVFNYLQAKWRGVL